MFRLSATDVACVAIAPRGPGTTCPGAERRVILVYPQRLLCCRTCSAVTQWQTEGVPEQTLTDQGFGLIEIVNTFLILAKSGRSSDAAERTVAR
jgi:hypothetical protein